MSFNKVIETDQTVRNYVIDLSKVVIVPPEVEKELFSAYKNSGCIESRNKLIESGLRFVVKVAQKFSKDLEHQKALISAGNEGLLVAIDRFDPTRGTRFLSYATWWVVLYIREELHRQSVVAIPIWRKKTARKVRAMQQKLEEELGREATLTELTDVSGLSTNQLTDILSDPPVTTSIDGVTQELAHDHSLEVDFSNRSADKLINYILMTLPVRERFILHAYFGFITDPPMSLKQISIILGISSERVRQVKIEALASFRRVLAEYQVTSIADVYS